MQILYTFLMAKSQMKWNQTFCSFSVKDMTVLYTLAWVLLFQSFLLFFSLFFFFLFFCYHLRNPFTFDECSVAEITLHYERAFDSPDACVLVSAWEFHYRCYWFGLSSFLWAVLHICHLTDYEYIAHLVVCILFHRKKQRYRWKFCC